MKVCQLTLLTPSFTIEKAPRPNSLASMYDLLNFLPGIYIKSNQKQYSKDDDYNYNK